MATDAMGRGWADVLAEIPLFAGLSKRQLNKIAKLGQTRRYARFTSIVRPRAGLLMSTSCSATAVRAASRS